MFDFKDKVILNLGPIYLGIALNTWFFGLVSYQYLLYFKTEFKDPRWIKLVVCSMATIDIVHSFSLIYLLWYFCVQNFTNPAVLYVPVWPYRITMFVTVVTAVIMHLFLSYRVMHFTSRKFCALMYGLTGVTFAIGVACATVTWIWVRTAEDMPRVNAIMSIWFGFEMITDTVLSGTLIHILLKSPSHFAKSVVRTNTLIRTALQTGVAASLFSILTLSFYIIRKETQIFAVFGIPIGRVYTNTLMDALLCRERLRESMILMKDLETISVQGTQISVTMFPPGSQHAQITIVDPSTVPHDNGHIQIIPAQQQQF